MANLMPEVAKLLGVEVGEPFYILQNGKHKCIYSDNDLYKITEEGLANINNTDGCYEYHSHCRVILTGLLLGECSVEKLPWEPKMYEHYFYPSLLKKEVVSDVWWGRTSDCALKVLGMVYRTREEAETHMAEDYDRLTGKPLSKEVEVLNYGKI